MAEPLTAERERGEAVASVIRLATGTAAERPPASWTDVLDVAIAERCAALAWARSGELIRRQAPAGEVARWRAFAVANDAFVRVQAAVLRDVVDVLRHGGVEPAVLKGIPLSVRLYGDAAARTTDDLDLLVSPPERAAARALLQREGWVPHFSESMLDDCYVREWSGQPVYLEIHTALVSELLAHVEFREPPLQSASTPGGDYRALSAAALPVYLAAHLAKHPFPYLLWSIDFATLWETLTSEERHQAQALARSARLSRWLMWAVARTEVLSESANADPSALRALGFAGAERCVTHGPREFVHNADTVGDAARVIGALVWPRHLRGDVGGFASLSLSRLQARLSWRASGRGVVA